MGKEIASYDTDPIISGDEKVIGTDDNGDTANYSIRDIAAYAQTDGTGRMAVYDGASDVADYEVETQVDTEQPLRFGLTGPLTDEDFFPTKFGTLLSNQLSAPAKSEFDFRFLTAGLMLEFDLEFDIKVTGAGGSAPVGTPEFYSFKVVATFPNGGTQTQTVIVKNMDQQGPAGALTNYVKLKFSTHIKTTGLDSLLGGGFDIVPDVTAATTNVYTVTNLKARAII